MVEWDLRSVKVAGNSNVEERQNVEKETDDELEDESNTNDVKTVNPTFDPHKRTTRAAHRNASALGHRVRGREQRDQ